MTTKKQTPHDATEGRGTDCKTRATNQHGAHADRTHLSPHNQERLFFRETIKQLEDELRISHRSNVDETAALNSDKQKLIETVADAAVRQHESEQYIKALSAENETLKKENKRLQDDNHRLKKFAHIDGLTGLERVEVFNHIGFPRAFGTAMRHDLNLVLIVIDLNNLKATNDNKSYAEGDKLIINAADAIKETTRSEDSIYKFDGSYRRGGDEFVVIATVPSGNPEKVQKNVRTILQRMSEAMSVRGVDCAMGACVIAAPESIPGHVEKGSGISYVEKPKMLKDHMEITRAEVGTFRDDAFKSAEIEMKADKAIKKGGKHIKDQRRE